MSKRAIWELLCATAIWIGELVTIISSLINTAHFWLRLTFVVAQLVDSGLLQLEEAVAQSQFGRV